MSKPEISVVNKSCGIAIAQSFMNQDLYLAWAGLDNGESAWTDEPPIIDSTATIFQNEICRRLVSEKKYLIQDDSGPILSGGYRWRESEEPTNCIMLKTNHDLSDVPNSTIYKVGIFAGTKLKPDVVKTFVFPYQLADSGYLVMSVNIHELVRSPTVAESREIILRF